MKSYISIVLAFLALALTACSGGNPKVNAFLDTYEDAVEKWEKQASSGSTFTINDINEMNSSNMELSSKASALENEEWSEAQKKKHMELSVRLQQAIQKVAQNIR